MIYPDLCYSCFIYYRISWVRRDSQKLLKSTSLSTGVPRIRICPWLPGISCCWFISAESPVPCSHPSWLYRPPELTSLCQIQWYNVSCREFLHSPSLLFFALSLPSIFSLSGLSHTCSWQLRDQELWCCKGYFISGNSHQFLPYCVGYPRTPRVSNAFVW